MSDSAPGPQTWHHGLVARWWAEFNHPVEEELRLYQGCIERFGQPALDLACGSGRLLLPLRAEGLDVDGIDVSDDMLSFAREAAERRGLDVRLERQAMAELDPARRYRSVYICDSFGIGGGREQDREALRRIHAALEPGGALVFSHDLPNASEQHWAYWLPMRRRELPLPWPEEGDRRRAADGDEIELSTRLFDLDPVAQLVTMQIRARLWRGAAPVREEEHTIRIASYFQAELLDMLADAGFGPIGVQSGYTGRPATPDDTMIVLIAQR